MQMGSIGLYEPEAPISDTRAVTMDAATGDTLIPSLAPFVHEDAPDDTIAGNAEFPRWLVIGGLFALVWFLAGKRGW